MYRTSFPAMSLFFKHSAKLRKSRRVKQVLRYSRMREPLKLLSILCSIYLPFSYLINVCVLYQCSVLCTQRFHLISSIKHSQCSERLELKWLDLRNKIKITNVLFKNYEKRNRFLGSYNFLTVYTPQNYSEMRILGAKIVSNSSDIYPGQKVYFEDKT